MNREPESALPMPRASLPEGCSELIDAYRLRSASKAERDMLLLRLAAIMHDAFVQQLDADYLRSGDAVLLEKKIQEFLRPILMGHRDLEDMIRPSSEFVETLMHVVLANHNTD